MLALPTATTVAEIVETVAALSIAEGKDLTEAAKVLAATGYANQRTLPFNAARYLGLARENPWLRQKAGVTSPWTARILRAVAGWGDGDSSPSYSSACPHLAVYTYPSHLLPLPQCERLRALYFLAVYRTLTTSGGGVSATRVEKLGSLIRRIENRSSKASDIDRLRSIADASSLEELVSGMDHDTAQIEHSFKDDWRHVWRPWLMNESQGTPPRPVSIRLRPPKLYPVPDDPGGPPPEPPPYNRPPVTPPGEPTSDRFDFAFVNQSLRTRNFSLIKDHIEVATDAEVRLVIASCAAYLKQSTVRNSAQLLPRLLIVLQIATGRVLESLLDARLGTPGSETAESSLYLDTFADVLYQPVPRPEHIFRPDENNALLFHERSEWLALPLPTLARNILRTLRAGAPQKAVRVADWLEGKKPANLLGAFLKEVPGLPSESREPARFRRWATCQIHQTTKDLAATMLVCGDSLGRSNAPLYYYCPRTLDILALYQKAMSPFLEMPRWEAHSEPGPDERLGPAALVRDDIAAAGVSKLSKMLNVSPVSVLESPEKTIRYHNQLVAYLATTICVVTSHRPTAALFEIRRSQFDLHRHYAVLGDKRSDQEHYTRLVATTSLLSDSLKYYFGHLDLLRQRLGASTALRSWICRVLESKQPILFELDATANPITGSIDAMRQYWPEIWIGLPPNWYRPYVSTKLRDLGAPAISVLAQMGHLEAAGHPYRDESVIAPAELLDPVREPLEELQRKLGLRVPRGLARTQLHPAVPLQDWRSHLKNHEKSARVSELRRAAQLRPEIRGARATALSWLDRQWPAGGPHWAVAYEALNPRSPKQRSPLPPTTVAALNESASAFVARIIEANDHDHRREPAVQIEVHNAISRRLKTLSSWGIECPNVGKVFRGGRAPLSPFPPQVTLATEHIHEMRIHLKELLRKPGRDLNQQAIQALTLAIYDPFLTPDQIFHLLDGSFAFHVVERSPIHLGGSLAPGKAPIGLTGLAALAADAHIQTAHPHFSRSVLDRELRKLVPASIVGKQSDGLLSRICETAAAAARIERPGLARHAYSASGAIDASLEAQFAALTQKMPPKIETPSRRISRVELAGDRPTQPPETVAPPSKQSVRRYRALLRLLVQPHQKSRNGGQPVTRAPTLDQIARAIRGAHPPPDPTAPLHVIDALAEFAYTLATSGTRTKANPAVNTIRTYLTTIGRVLLDVFGDIDLRSLQEEDLESAYEIVAGSVRQHQSQQRALLQLEDFHTLLIDRFGLPAVNLPVSAAASENLQNRPVPRLLSHAQYRGALRWLQVTSTFGPSPLGDCLGRRALLAASIALILLRHTGARIGEITLLRLSDITVLRGEINLTIRPSIFCRLKSGAARRRIKLGARLEQDERVMLLRWLRAERLRNIGKRRSLLFPTFDYPQLAIGTGVLRKMIQLAFEQGSLIRMHPHELRHLRVSEHLPALTRDEHPNPDNPFERQRRAETFRHEIGHASLTTSVTYYLHRSTPLKQIAAPDALYADRWTIAGLADRKVEAVDKVFQRHKHMVAQSGERWIDWVGVRSPAVDLGEEPDLSLSPAAINDFFEPLAEPYRHLDQLFRICACARDIRRVASGFGYSPWHIQQILDAAGDLAYGPARYRLLTETRGGRTFARSVPRQSATDIRPRLLDFNNASVTTVLADQFVETYRPFYAHRDVLTGDAETLTNMKVNLATLGIRVAVQSSDRKKRPMKLELIENRGAFHQLCWSLAIIKIVDSVIENMS